jgi:hypothetical protein
MTTIDTTAGTAVRQKHGAGKRPGVYTLHVALSQDDAELARKTINEIGMFTGQRPSMSVLLRAGIAVMADPVKQAKAEKHKKPDEHGRTETNLRWALASAARLANGVNRG